MYKKCLFLILVVLLAGCSGFSPSSQSVFNNPPMFSDSSVSGAINQDDNIKDYLDSFGDKTNSKLNTVDRKINNVQENYNAVQNSLVGLSGKVADFKTDIDKIAELNTEITALKGDVALQSEVNANLTAQLKAEIKAEMQNEINGIKAQIQSEVTGIKANINTNSNLPVSFMVMFGLICLLAVGGLIVIIIQNNYQRKELRALKENAPVILPFNK